MSRSFFDIDQNIISLSDKAESACAEAFSRIEETCRHNSAKTLCAFMQNRVSEAHLGGSSGYGYGDRGRDTLDEVFAQIFGAEDALVRHTFQSGTAAIVTALFGVLRPGDRIVSLTGRPYDTIHGALGLRGENIGSLKEFGIRYEEISLLPDGKVDTQTVEKEIKGAKVAYIQRSRGYSLRPSLTVAQIGELTSLIKNISPSTIVMVDNCYGEFVEKTEPTQVGADIIMGSLIKNPGGGIARTGGYIAGRRDLIELCAHRMTAPGVGREAGCTLGENKNMYMGLFFAPEVVAAALKTAVFAAELLSELGFKVLPHANEPRADIIQTIVLETPEKLTAFCRGIQKGAPIDSFLIPEAWDMPGYGDPVIMAAGAFNLGASIELSADGPMRPPYAAWMQGGLTWSTGRIGVMLAAQSVSGG